MRRNNKMKKNNKGFTLVEIMIVLALVTMLGGFAGVKLINFLKQGRRDGAKIELSQFQQALEAYYLQNSNYPTTAQGLDGLVHKPSTGKIPENFPAEGFFGKKQIPKDPFGNQYRYESEDGQHYKISSDGPDQQQGTDDDVVVDNT